MKRGGRGGWECLPGELIACILEKLEDDFKAISAVRGVCKHWNQSSLLLTALTPKPYPCNKHNKGCICYLTALTNFISKATSLGKLDLSSGDWNVSLGASPLLSDCHSLRELHIDSWNSCTLSFELELVARLRKLTVNCMIPNQWLASIPLTNMEELTIRSLEVDVSEEGEAEVTLKGPKLLKLYVTLFVRLVNVEAPLLSSLRVTGRGHLHVSDACQCETVTIAPGILLVHAPECVKKLVIEDELCGGFPQLSCRAVPRITSLCITFPDYMDDVDDGPAAELFFKEVGSLAELKELTVNTFFLNWLAGSVPSSRESFLPSLKVFTLDTTIEDTADLYQVDELIDTVVNTLSGLKGLFGATAQMKMEHSLACVEREDVAEAVRALQTAVAGLLSR